MKKIIGALALATGLFACASNSVKYNQSQFRSENYQREMTNSIEYADSFVDFDQRHIPQASLDATDFAVLLSADVSYNQNAYAQAAGKYYYLANKYHDPRLIYKAIVCFEHSSVTAGDYAKLNSLIAQLLIAAPDSNTAHLFGISVELDKNDLVAAKEDLNAVIQADPAQVRSVLLFLSTIVSSHLTRETPASFEPFAAYVAKKYSSYPEAQLFASVIYSITGNQEGLFSNLDIISSNYPNWEIPVYWSASILAKKNNLSLLTAMTNHEMQKTTKPSSTLQNLYISNLIQNNEFFVANQYIESSLGSTPTDGNMLINNAIVQYKLGHNSQAANALLQAESQGVNLDGTVYLSLATLYDLNGQAESALEYYKKAGSMNPILASATNLGILRNYFDLNKIQAANDYIDNMAKVSQLTPRETSLLKLSLYSEMERNDLAYQLVAEKIHLYPNDKAFLYFYASLSGMTGRTSQAIQAYKKYIKINPSDSAGYNDLGFTLADKTSQYALAYKYAQKAYSMSPNDFAVLDTLGWVNFKLKKYSEAESYIYAAYRQTQDSDTAMHLKQVYLAQGKIEQANKVILISPKLQQMQFEQTLADQAMLILMYYQFGLDLAQ